MRFNKADGATKRRSDEATKGKKRLRLTLRRFVASSLRRSPHAFSLIEIMIVVVIIGLLAGVVTYSTATYLDKAKRTRARSDIASLAGAVDQFYGENSRYPTNQDGLKVLAPQFVKAVPNDPWGRAYIYVSPGRTGPYDIISYGADGREGGTGADADISNANLDVSRKPK